MLAIGDDERSLAAGFEFRTLLDHIGQLNTPIYVRLEHYRQFGELVQKSEAIAQFQDRLQVFGTLEETLDPKIIFQQELDLFAQALHKDYCRRPPSEINPLANCQWEQLPEFMKMSNRWRADHTPFLMELAGFRILRDIESPTVLDLTSDQVEFRSRLEHRRYAIERSLIDRSPGYSQINEWCELSESDKEWNRREVRRLPEIMATLGMQLEPVRDLRFQNASLSSAEQAIENLLCRPAREHLRLVVDLDDPQAVRIAARALALPSRSVWLHSREVPREFFLRKPLDGSTGRSALLHAANGWAPQNRAAFPSRTAVDK